MVNVLRALLVNGLAICAVCPNDGEVGFVAAHIRETGRQVGCVVTSPAAFDYGVAMLPASSTMSAPVPLSELTWPDDIDFEDFVVKTWSADAADAVGATIETIEMEARSLVVVICRHERLAGALVHAIMKAIELKDPALRSASKTLRVVESVIIPHGGPAFILRVESGL